MEYSLSKQLENELLNYLNMVQPLQYINTITNEPLIVVPYYPSLYKYSKFDIYNAYVTIELKTRSKKIIELQNNILDTCKVLSNHSIFMFSYDNTLKKLNDLNYISYDHTLFDTFELQITKNNDELFVIPIWSLNMGYAPYMKSLNTTIPQSHKIYINYTNDYKIQLQNIIATDKDKYLKTFGIYAL
jgi:hypothetical protein